jgi:hypothetical protein
MGSSAEEKAGDAMGTSQWKVAEHIELDAGEWRMVTGKILVNRNLCGGVSAGEVWERAVLGILRR